MDSDGERGAHCLLCFCSYSVYYGDDAMNKEDKIQEVMKLVDRYAEAVERSVRSGDSCVKFLKEESDIHSDIQSKLRELIQ